MPQVTITLAQGRTPEQLRAMMHEVHAAVLRTVRTRPEHIRVVVHEVPRTHWATGDTTLAEAGAAPAAGCPDGEPDDAPDGEPGGAPGGEDTTSHTNTVEKEPT